MCVWCSLIYSLKTWGCGKLSLRVVGLKLVVSRRLISVRVISVLGISDFEVRGLAV